MFMPIFRKAVEAVIPGVRRKREDREYQREQAEVYRRAQENEEMARIKESEDIAKEEAHLRKIRARGYRGNENQGLGIHALILKLLGGAS
jgi:hypothetical protein